MPYRVTKFEPTPNPNAIKCAVDPSPASAPRSYFNADQAAGDDLAQALFAIEGVTNVLIHTTFVTVGKSPDARWPAIKKAVQRVLAEAP